jgi:hypothetical protein
MSVDWRLGEGLFSQLQGDAGVALAAMPEGVIILPLDDFRHLGQLRLQFLETDHVRALTLQPFLDLSGAGADAVHIPRGDFHE